MMANSSYQIIVPKPYPNDYKVFFSLGASELKGEGHMLSCFWGSGTLRIDGIQSLGHTIFRV